MLCCQAEGNSIPVYDIWHITTNSMAVVIPQTMGPANEATNLLPK